MNFKTTKAYCRDNNRIIFRHLLNLAHRRNRPILLIIWHQLYCLALLMVQTSAASI